MRRSLVLFLLLGVSGWIGLRYYRQQSRLHQQLAQLTAVLAIENNRVTKEAQNTIKRIEADVLKSHNQPADRAFLYRAEALQACARQLVDTLRAYGHQLRHATNSPAGTLPLWHLSATSPTGPALSQGSPRRWAYEQRLAAYVDTLRQLHLAAANPFSLLTPAFDKATPMVEKLADLSQLESEVLTRQAFALQRIAEAVSTQRWLTQPLITATAKTNVVAPGDTYFAQLGLVGYYSATKVPMHMTCNGRPIPIGPTGIGLVHFRAPTRPGPATWAGTIRLNQNGRDTTFKVTVPYHVARR